MLNFRALWSQALPFEEFVATSAVQYRGLWETIHRLARVPAWAETMLPPGQARRLLVIAEDWCGDASNTVPVLNRWVESVSGMSLRIIRRDEHPEVMNRYLTNGARSIPIVIVLDEDFQELGHWGPRPAELQAWVMANRATMPKDARYKETRRWYARDHGESTIREVSAVLGVRERVGG
ncbi:MAG TPA: thioredoxin family protein [Gemmatimonadales bacterium]|nr:thioredoxin family protein [Gemmatimonadales bacterium]